MLEKVEVKLSPVQCFCKHYLNSFPVYSADYDQLELMLYSVESTLRELDLFELSEIFELVYREIVSGKRGHCVSEQYLFRLLEVISCLIIRRKEKDPEGPFSI